MPVPPPESLGAQVTPHGIQVRLRGAMAVTHTSYWGVFTHMVLAAFATAFVLGSLSGPGADDPITFTVLAGLFAIVAIAHLVWASLQFDRLDCTGGTLRIGGWLRRDRRIPLSSVDNVTVRVVPAEYARSRYGFETQTVVVPEQRFLVIHCRNGDTHSAPSTHEALDLEWLAIDLRYKAMAVAAASAPRHEPVRQLGP